MFVPLDIFFAAAPGTGIPSTSSIAIAELRDVESLAFKHVAQNNLNFILGFVVEKPFLIFHSVVLLSASEDFVTPNILEIG